VTLRLSLSVRVATLGDLKHNGIRPSPRFGQAAGPRPGRWPSARPLALGQAAGLRAGEMKRSPE
jgi:hypothetical protein